MKPYPLSMNYSGGESLRSGWISVVTGSEPQNGSLAARCFKSLTLLPEVLFRFRVSLPASNCAHCLRSRSLFPRARNTGPATPFQNQPDSNLRRI